MTNALPVEQAIEAILELVIRSDSGNRAGAMAHCFITEQRPEVVWPVFLQWWNHCDATWDWRMPFRAILTTQMRKRDGTDHPAAPWMSEEDLEFYRSLPDEITLYRGCARKQVKGLAWSTDRKAAERFAHGHRGIEVPDPVLAETIFPTEKVFAVFTNRNENEVVIDYDALGKIKRHKYTPPPKKDGPSDDTRTSPMEQLLKQGIADGSAKPVSAEELAKLMREGE
jgi:hypothetical protein